MTAPQPYEIRLVVQPDASTSTGEPTFLAHWQNAAGQLVTQPLPLQPPRGRGLHRSA